MWAYITYSGGKIYFADIYDVHQTYVYLCGRQSSWTAFGRMSNISNTKLYYVKDPEGSNWGEILGWVVIANSSSKSNSNFDSWSSCNWYSSWNTYGFASGSTYTIVPSSGDGNCSVTTSYLSNGYSGLNSTQTIKSYVSTNGAVYANANSKATISITSYAMSGDGTAAKQTASISTSAKSTTISAALTGKTTLSIGDVASGYVFMGWYKSDGTFLSNSTSYTYYPTGATEVHARFATKYTTGATLYLIPNSDWKKDGARFAACFGGDAGQTWVDCSQVGTSGYYSVTVPSGNWGYVIFCRMDGSKATNNWDNKWNQASDMFASNTTNGAEITGWNNSQTWRTVYGGLSVTRNIDAAANAPTITNSQTAIKSGSSVTVNAQTEKTGYNWSGWTSSNGSFGTASNKSTTFTPTANGAVATANYTEKSYSLTFTHNGLGSIKVDGTTVASGGTASVNHHTTKSLQAIANTGYRFTGWTKSGTNASSVTIADVTSAGTLTTIKSSATDATVTAGFAAKNYTVTLDKNGGDSDGSITTTYDSSSTDDLDEAGYAGHSCTGYYDDPDDGEGNLIINADGTIPSSTVSGWLSSGTWVKDGDDITLYAHWEENLVYYDVTFGVGTSYTSLGSISATNNTTSSSISSGDDLLSASSVTFTASPNTGYTVEGWYTNAACTEGKHDAGSTTYTIASLSSDVTVYVKFVEKTWSVAFAAGTGGSVTTPAATPQTVGQLTGISIAATPSTGYTFKQWSITSGSGSFTSAATTNSNTFKPTAASTITASFNETKSTITVTTATSSQGTLKFGSTSKSWGTTASLGVATTQSITATAAAGFRFVRWDLTGAAASASSLTSSTITLKADGSGSTGTATAVFEEDLSSPWIVAGGNKIVTTGTTWRTTADANNTMLKKTGHSTESVVYFTVPVTTVCSGDNNGNFQFKIYNTSTSKWYGLFASGSYYLLKAEDGTEKSLVEDNQNIELRAYVTGDYEFKLDYSTSTPKLTVTWPVFNQVRISAASPTDATNTGDFDLSSPVSNVRSKTLSLNANTTYTFKIVYNSDFYGYNSGTFTRNTSTSSNSRTISTSGGDMTLTTDYAGDYTFKFNESTKALSVDFPTAYKVTYGKGTINGSTGSCTAVDLDNSSAAVTSNSTWVKKGHQVKLTAPTEDSGYSFDGWFDNNSSTGDAITTAKNCTITVASAETYYACYHEHKTAITINTDGHGTITTPSPNNSPYSLGVATMQNINASANTGYHWNTWTVSGTAAVNSSAATQSNKAKGDGTEGGTGTVTATFSPNTYSVQFNGNGSDGGSMSKQTGIAYDSETTLTANAFTRTGYTFLGWATTEERADAGTVDRADEAEHDNLTSTNSATVNLWAVWDANDYTVTLDYDETNHGDITTTPPTGSVTATYDAEMPEISILPKAAEGYAFMGFFSEAGGNGTQYYDGTGASVTNWNVDDEITLYAYYKKAEITALTLDAAIVETNATVGVTPTVSPTPTGNTKLCFYVFHSNDNPLSPQPEISWNGTKATFDAGAVSGTYKVGVSLRTGTACGGGTLLDSTTIEYQVAGSHTVTVNYKCGDDVIKAATSLEGIRPLDWSDDITAPDIFGYTFSSWSSADGVTIKDSENEDVTSSSDATIKIKATYAGSLTANYTQNQMIFFKNTLEWENVYVNFYTAAKWTSGKGSGNQGVTNKNIEMTQIGETDVWYYDYGAASITPSLYVSFTSDSQDGYEFFWKSGGVNVVYPANYPDDINTDKSSETGFKAATPMFVPLATQDKVTLNSNSGGKADYYNAGYWTKYTSGTGYTLEIYNSAGNSLIKSAEFTSADELMPMKATVDLEGGTTYKFQLKRSGDIYYGNSGTMTYANHGDPTPWDMTNGSFSMCGITTNAAGDYTFNLSYSGNSSTPPHYYRLRMAVDYPVASGDYRLVYSDAVQTKEIKSAIVTKKNDGSDIVSFFVRSGSTPVLRIQQATVDGKTGAITWKEYPTDGTPTNQITGSIASAITKDTVYNFNLSMNGSGALSVASAVYYSGNYYIRTDAANSKWDNYRTDPDHRMTYSEYSITHGGYTHYYTHWIDKDETGRKNVKFVIANDYSPNISDTLARESASGTWANIASFMEEGGDLKRSANVRFMWNIKTNAISRAYIDGAQEDGSEFLTIQSSDSKIKNAAGDATLTQVTFSDNGNWMYEANIKAQPTAQIKLLSKWGTSNIITQYFRGGAESTETLIGGSGENWYDIRLIYDFKTNRMIAGLIPSGNIEDPMAINADVMFVREHHGDIAQLTFTDDGAITDIKTAFGVLQFNKWTINNKSTEGGHSPLSPLLSRYERDLFYVSFPFKVAMEDVFGFGTYGQHWIIEEYDGASRAANGYWLESDPNWKFIFNRKNRFFEPGIGYIIALDLDEMGESADIWANTDRVELYFPSYGTMDNITSSTATYDIPAHLCTINRTVDASGNPTGLPADYDRRVKDSHWNVLGVPTYVNPDAPNFANTAWTTEATETSIGPNFLYAWNMTDNSVSPVSASGYTYHAMHAYLVQYCGDVKWTSSVSVEPSSIVARRTSAERPQSVEFRLQMQQNDVTVDQTFVKLSDDEHVTTGFEFNYDLSKEFNKNRSNIYTFIGTEQVAGNVLPMSEQTTVVPVGVIAKTTGDYTFAIPEGTEGIGVTLIDNETGIRTSLSALTYTVNLEAGTYNERFVLEISPISQVLTDIDNVQSDDVQGTKAHKIMIDGLLYIVKDGVMYDARGARVE